MPDYGVSGPTRRYALIVAMLVGLSSVPTLVMCSAGAAALDDDPMATVPLLDPWPENQTAADDWSGSWRGAGRAEPDQSGTGAAPFPARPARRATQPPRRSPAAKLAESRAGRSGPLGTPWPEACGRTSNRAPGGGASKSRVRPGRGRNGGASNDGASNGAGRPGGGGPTGSRPPSRQSPSPVPSPSPTPTLSPVPSPRPVPSPSAVPSPPVAPPPAASQSPVAPSPVAPSPALPPVAGEQSVPPPVAPEQSVAPEESAVAGER